MEEKMQELYSDLKDPAGLASIRKLYDAIKKINKNVKIKDVKRFLSKKQAYTLTKVTKNRFPRRKMIFPRSGHTVIVDITYVKYYEQCNVPYLLVILDAFSRFATVFPLTTLKAVCVANVLDEFFGNSVYKIKNMFCDNGKEFYNTISNKVYMKHGINRYSTNQSEIKASIVERFHKTLKEKISRYVIEYNNERYLDKLQLIVSTYNNTIHSSLLGKTPTEVYLMNDWQDIKLFKIELYKKHKKKIKSFRELLPIEQVVRIKSVRDKFTRSYHLRNSYELFKIAKVNVDHIPHTYELKDFNGEKIEGIFYREELIIAYDDGLYAIDILKKRKVRDMTQYYVKYVNFPSCKPEWISATQLEKLV